MLINIDDFIDGESKFVSFSKNIDLPLEYSVNGFTFASVSGNIIKFENKFRFQGKVSAILKFNCDLCLEPFDFDLQFNIDETFLKTDTDSNYSNHNNYEEDDLLTFSGNIINLEPIILSNILINKPMKTICSENCKGLCSICGCNLNLQSCSCVKANFNPEFEKLKALFEENEEEV